ncbi:MAG: hypothetical protein JXR96_22535 [Deltaproteobacteria bacterium]|nr:hypothetical protein [Deltaproteobacteria bacterium]
MATDQAAAAAADMPDLPKLTADQDLLYRTAQAFLDDFEQGLPSGKLLVQTSKRWPLRRAMELRLLVQGIDRQLRLHARPTARKGEQTELEIQSTQKTTEALEAMVAAARSPAKAATASPARGTVKQTAQQPAAAAGQEQAPSPPVLGSDRVLTYPSLDALKADREQHISKGLLYTDTSESLSLHEQLDLELAVARYGPRCKLSAEVVFCGKGKAGLQLRDPIAAAEAVTSLLSELESAQLGAEQPEAAPTFAPMEGETLSRGDLDEISSVRPKRLEPGSLKGLSPFSLLSSVALSGQSAELRFEMKTGPVHLRFNPKGRLVRFAAPGSDEDLLERLCRAGRMPRSKQRDLLERRSPDKSILRMLQEEKLVSSDDLWDSVRDQALEALEAVRKAGRCRFRLDPAPAGPKNGARFNTLIVPWMRTALEALGDEAIKELRAPLDDGFPAVDKEHARWLLSSSAIDRRGAKLVNEMLDGTRSLLDALAPFPLSYHKRLVYLALTLTSLGLIEIHEESLDENAEDPLALLEADLAKLEKADHFARAGVHWSAHESSYGPTFQKMERTYGPHGKLARKSDHAAKMCQRRLEMARVAQEYLKDRSRRVGHRKQVIAESQLQHSAELLVKQAELHILKLNWRRARELLEAAIEMHPLPEYKEKLGKVPR